MVYLNRIFELAKSSNSKNRRYAAYLFQYFSDFPDKERAWDELHKLTQDEDDVVKQTAAFAFRSFSDFPDKKKAWDDLHRLTQDKNSVVRQNAAADFRNFSDFPDKEEAWDDLHRLTQDENSVVRQNAALAFQSFSDFPDKEEAWNDLHRLTQDENSVVRQNAAFAFQSFSDFPDKAEAWDDLHRLTHDENSVVRQNAAFAYQSFSDFPDKEKAWDDLHKLTQDMDSVVRLNAARDFVSFSDFPDKEEAWNDLHRLTQDENSVVRQNAAFAFRNFSDFPDKEKAWDDLHRLTRDRDSVVRQTAAFAFQTSFSDFPDKEKAWDDLHRLTQDMDSVVRQNAARDFVSFSDFPDKEEAWDDLHKLTQDMDSVVRQNAAFVFQYIYAKVSQKNKLLDWLSKLTEDKSNRVKAAAYYSLARIYVYESSKASTEQRFNENYNEAIKFFEKAYYFARWDTIKFCFTVHNLFYKILIGDVKSVDEIRNNINQWKNRPIESEERQHLLEILESLGNVLEETLIAKKHGENVWRYKEKVLPYCNKADELIKVLKHSGIKEIATKAKDRVEEEYLKTVNILLTKVNTLINEPDLLEKELFPTIREFCELISEPVIRDKIKQDISEIQNEKNKEVRIKLGLRLLKDIKYYLEISSKAKDREINHKEEIISIKDEVGKKGWYLLKFMHPKKISDKTTNSGLKIKKIVEIFTIPCTISAFIWGIIYVVLDKIQYPSAMGISLIITGLSFIVISIISFKKRQ